MNAVGKTVVVVAWDPHQAIALALALHASSLAFAPAFARASPLLAHTSHPVGLKGRTAGRTFEEKR